MINSTLAARGFRLPTVSPRAHEQARRYALALVLVAAVFVGKRLIFGGADVPLAFLLFDVAVAATALWSGAAPALVAVVAAALLGWRELADREITTLPAVLQFAAGASVVASIVAWLARDRRRVERAFAAEHEELERVRSAMRALELQHAAATREMSELHERFRQQSRAEQAATLGRLDATTEQLQRLEVLTDPALSELPPGLVVQELLGRIQVALGADAAVLVDARDAGRPLVLGPDVGHLSTRREPLKRALAAGQRSSRVHLVQNDPARLADTSVIAWDAEVTTLVSVPVACAGTILGVIEVVMRRARRWTDWDTALLRVVADRSAWVLMAPHIAEPLAVSRQNR